MNMAEFNPQNECHKQINQNEVILDGFECMNLAQTWHEHDVMAQTLHKPCTNLTNIAEFNCQNDFYKGINEKELILNSFKCMNLV